MYIFVHINYIKYSYIWSLICIYVPSIYVYLIRICIQNLLQYMFIYIYRICSMCHYIIIYYAYIQIYTCLYVCVYIFHMFIQWIFIYSMYLLINIYIYIHIMHRQQKINISLQPPFSVPYGKSPNFAKESPSSRKWYKSMVTKNWSPLIRAI